MRDFSLTTAMDSERQKHPPSPPCALSDEFKKLKLLYNDCLSIEVQGLVIRIEAQEEKYGISNKHLDLRMRIDALQERAAFYVKRKRAEELNRSHPKRMQYIEKEGNDAMEEFSRIVEDEKERIQQVADKEKERIMQDMRTNGTIGICPLCLEEISPIVSPEEHISGGKAVIMRCCGALHCNDCALKSLEFMLGKSNDFSNAKCYNCRHPITRSVPAEMEKTLKPNDKRHWILNGLAMDYMTGNYGFKKNTMKGIKLFKRAAELGNTCAQDALAQYYFNGGIFGLVVPKCLQKARYYAEKATDQANSQYILAQLIKDSDNHNIKE